MRSCILFVFLVVLSWGSVQSAEAQQVAFHFVQSVDTLSVGANGEVIGVYSVSTGPGGCAPQYVQTSPPYPSDFVLGAGQGSEILCYPSHVGLNQDSLHFRIGLDGSQGCTGEAMITLPVSAYALPDSAIHLRYQHPGLRMHPDSTLGGYSGRFYFSLLNGYLDSIRSSSFRLTINGNDPATLKISDSVGSVLSQVALAPFTTRTTYFANVHSHSHSFDSVRLLFAINAAGRDSEITIDEPVYWTGNLGVGVDRAIERSIKLISRTDSHPNELALAIEAPRDEVYYIEVLDMLGRRLSAVTVQCVAGLNELRLSLPSLPVGAYLCRVTSGTGTQVLKF